MAKWTKQTKSKTNCVTQQFSPQYIHEHTIRTNWYFQHLYQDFHTYLANLSLVHPLAQEFVATRQALPGFRQTLETLLPECFPCLQIDQNVYQLAELLELTNNQPLVCTSQSHKETVIFAITITRLSGQTAFVCVEDFLNDKKFEFVGVGHNSVEVLLNNRFKIAGLLGKKKLLIRLHKMLQLLGSPYGVESRNRRSKFVRREP